MWYCSDATVVLIQFWKYVRNRTCRQWNCVGLENFSLCTHFLTTVFFMSLHSLWNVGLTQSTLQMVAELVQQQNIRWTATIFQSYAISGYLSIYSKRSAAPDILTILSCYRRLVVDGNPVTAEPLVQLLQSRSASTTVLLCTCLCNEVDCQPHSQALCQLFSHIMYEEYIYVLAASHNTCS